MRRAWGSPKGCKCGSATPPHRYRSITTVAGEYHEICAAFRTAPRVFGLVVVVVEIRRGGCRSLEIKLQKPAGAVKEHEPLLWQADEVGLNSFIHHANKCSQRQGEHGSQSLTPTSILQFFWSESIVWLCSNSPNGYEYRVFGENHCSNAWGALRSPRKR